MSDNEDPRFPTWPHLDNLDRIKVEHPEWFNDAFTWVVTEKIHGFNARFGLTAQGLPWCGSRNTVVHTGYPETWPRDGLQGFVGYAADHIMPLVCGTTMFGEWAGKGVQKGVDYGEKNLYLFGIMDDGKLIAWDTLCDSAMLLGIKTVPPLYYHKGLPSIEQLTEWRDGQSSIATTQREGIAITQDPPARDGYGHYLIGKFKGAAFSENARAAKPPRELPDMTVLQNFVDDYATPVRFEHVLQQVAEELRGQFDNEHKDALDVRNTGRVLQSMYEDVVREAGAEYEALSESDRKLLGKVLNTATKKLLDAARMTALGGLK